MPTAQTFLNHIKEYRITNRLSQKEVRVRTNFSASAYSKLESGQRNAKLDEILDIISGFNLSAVELIYWLTDAGVRFQELETRQDCCYDDVAATLKERLTTV